MGFHRTLQRQAIPQWMLADIIRPIVRESAQAAAAFYNRVRDPFLIEHDCANPHGHQFIGSCGDVVCVHCTKVVAS